MNIMYCADVIATYQDKVVLVERLKDPKGLALPGGKLEYGESLEDCARREFKEETGLDLIIARQLHTYSDPLRDPRGHRVSTVYSGYAVGTPRDEPGATRVRLATLDEVTRYADQFVCDHYLMIEDCRAAER
ncbi:MAG: NUDIX hydrolase [Nanoarchaeota archaeon]